MCGTNPPRCGGLVEETAATIETRASRAPAAIWRWTGAGDWGISSRMDKRTRVCVWIILLGLANFVAYAVGWAVIGGDAMNGYARCDPGPDGARRFFLVRHGAEVFEVGRVAWVYSAVHSISVPLTVGAVVLSMLTLAKDRLIASMQSTIIHGRLFITLLAVAIAVLVVVIAAYFTWYTVAQLSGAELLSAAEGGVGP